MDDLPVGLSAEQYAAALRHVAELVEADEDRFYDSMAGFSSLTPADLRDLALEVLAPVCAACGTPVLKRDPHRCRPRQ